MSPLLREIKRHYRTHKRSHLPWRRTRDPYHILVSEVMLQQTQVSRVIPYYGNFLKRFPTTEALSKAALSDVLRVWQGLGYNRRAKYLHEAAKIITEKGFPRTAEDIEKLPGVGHYTARAVATFAFGASNSFIETNIRTVFLHFCFPHRRAVSDRELFPLVARALKRSGMRPRDFCYALMDYGAYLKQNGVRLNARSTHYQKQSKFEGSRRQLRGLIVRESLAGPVTLAWLIKKISPTTRRGDIRRELSRLQREGLVPVKDR